MIMTNDDKRKRDLALLHIAPKELGLTDQVRKDIIQRISNGRTRSCAQLTSKERFACLQEFKRLGWQGKVCGNKVKPKQNHQSKQAYYLIKLWEDAVKIGKAHNAGIEGLQSFVCSVNRLKICILPSARLEPFNSAELSVAISAVRRMVDRGK